MGEEEQRAANIRANITTALIANINMRANEMSSKAQQEATRSVTNLDP